jgi:endonuclease/exonuclease/phosphatase family metal-dependent hydrolase
VTTIATWNVGDGKDASKADGLDRLARHGADVIGLQECGDREQMLKRWCEQNGWEMFAGSLPGAPSVPILSNPRAVKATHSGTTPATPATFVGRAGAGPSTMKPKVWNRVRFAADGVEVVVINGHLVPSVYLPRRRKLARRQIAVLAEMVERREGKVPVVAVGDFNMKPGDRLTKPLRALGMRQRTHDATHGRRTIDLIWTLGCDGRAEVVGMPSDHRAVVFNLKEKS